MKKVTLGFISKATFLGAMAIALTMGTACSDDDDNNGGTPTPTPPAAPKNEITNGGTTFELAEGLFIDYGSAGTNSFNLDLFLLTEDADLNTTTGNLSGSGALLYVEFFTSTNDKLEPGVYQFDAVNLLAPNTFQIATFLRDFNTAEGSQGTSVEVNGGSVTVDIIENQYEFEIDLTSNNGSEIKGYYKGQVPIIPARIGQEEPIKEMVKGLSASNVE